MFVSAPIKQSTIGQQIDVNRNSFEVFAGSPLAYRTRIARRRLRKVVVFDNRLALPSPIVVFTGFESVTKNVSSASIVVSLRARLSIVPLVFPGKIVTVPLAAM